MDERATAIENAQEPSDEWELSPVRSGGGNCCGLFCCAPQ